MAAGVLALALVVAGAVLDCSSTSFAVAHDGGTAESGSSDSGDSADSGAGQNEAGASDAGTDALDKSCAELATAQCSYAATCAPGSFVAVHGPTGLASAAVANQQGCVAERYAVCRDSIAARGSPTTATGRETCAAAIVEAERLDAACGVYFSNGTIPSCSTSKSGAEVMGTPCAYDPQCGSQYCQFTNATTCGTCQARQGNGGACRASSDCADSLGCNVVDDAGVCVPLARAGSPCTDNGDCVPGNGCVGVTATITDGGTCVPFGVSVGTPCQVSERSAPTCWNAKGVYCTGNLAESSCQPITYAGAGQTCDESTGVFCAASGFCSKTTTGAASVCLAPVANGAACDNVNGPLCTLPARCVQPGTTPGTCQASTSALCPPADAGS